MLEGKFLDFIFTNYGIFGVVGVLAILLFLKLTNPWERMSHVAGLFRRTPNSVNYSAREVLLSKLDYWLSFKIGNIRMNDPGRQMLFRDILKLKFAQFHQYVTEASECITEEMTGQQMFSVVVEKFNDAVDGYERGAIERGIPEVVMVKYGNWQLRSYDFLLKSTELVCAAQGYGSNEARMDAIYALITAMMEITIAEAEKTLTDLNGELTGIEYKGVVCG